MTAIETWNQNLLRRSAAMLAMPQVKLDSNRQPVSIATFVQVEQLRAARPAGGLPDSTAKVAKKQENITMSLRMKIQKPYAGHDPLRRRARVIGNFAGRAPGADPASWS